MHTRVHLAMYQQHSYGNAPQEKSPAELRPSISIDLSEGLPDKDCAIVDSVNDLQIRKEYRHHRSHLLRQW